MALFGKGGRWTEKAQILGAGLRDIGGSLSGGQTGYLNQYQAQQEQQAQKAQRQQAYDRLIGQMFPTGQAKGGGMGAAMADVEGLAPQQGQVRRPMTLEDAMPYLMRAQGEGLDIDPIVESLKAIQPKPDQYQFMNVGDGTIWRGNERTGGGETVYSAPPAPPKPTEWKTVERDDGIYAFNPVTMEIKKISNSRKQYAPPRSGGSSGGYTPPPAGYVLDK